MTIFLVNRFKYKFNQTSFYLFAVVEEKKRSFEICRNQSKMRDDGYDEKNLRVANKKQRSSKFESEAWNCLGPLGKRSGLFLLSLLKRRSEINASASKYKVWKVGQSEEHAIPLNDAISQIFTCKVEEKLKFFC